MNEEMNVNAVVDWAEANGEVIPEPNNLGKKVALGALGVGLITGGIVLFAKFRHKLAEKRDKRAVEKLRKKGYLVTEPIPDLEENDCDEAK